MPKTPKTPKTPHSRRRDDEDVLSTGAVARACGVSRDGVAHWIRSGKLPAFRTPGGHYRVRRDDLSVFLRASRSRFPGSPRDGGSRILVVDDEPSIVNLLRDLLVEDGYEVVTAEDPVQAMEVVSDHVPDLVITDVALPGGGGVALTRQLRQNPALATVPVIAVTGDCGEKNIERIYRAGADVLITKPFRSEHLLAEVHRLLKGMDGMPPGGSTRRAP